MTINKSDSSQEILSLYSDIKKLPINDLVPNMKPDLVTADEVNDFLQTISDSHGISKDLALLGVSLLFLKGACNNSAPNRMSITLKTPEGNVELTKYDLEYACHLATKNKFLRRIAQFLAPQICSLAEANGIPGDLAVKLNNLAIAKENSTGPLSTKEKAWACSFVQEVDNLSKLASPRLVALLAEDYNKNLANKKTNKKQNNKQAATEERKWRNGKKKTDLEKNKTDSDKNKKDNKGNSSQR